MIIRWTDKETKEVPGAGVLIPQRLYDVEGSLAEALIAQGQAKKSTSKELEAQEKADRAAAEKGKEE